MQTDAFDRHDDVMLSHASKIEQSIAFAQTLVPFSVRYLKHGVNDGRQVVLWVIVAWHSGTKQLNDGFQAEWLETENV